MNQVIVRVRDCRTTYTRTISRYYFCCITSYKEDLLDCIGTLLPGQELYIKVGNKYSKFISYEEVLEASEIDNITFEEELYHQLMEDDSLNYHMKEYLPEW